MQPALFGIFTWAGQCILGHKKLTCMVGKKGGGLCFLVEMELKMSKMPSITNLNDFITPMSI